MEASQKTWLGPKCSPEMKVSQMNHHNPYFRLFQIVCFFCSSSRTPNWKTGAAGFCLKKCCHQFVKTWPIPVRCDQTGAQVRLLTDDLPEGDSSCSSEVQTWFIIVSLGFSAASFLFVWQRAEAHHDIMTLINMVNWQQCLKQRDKGVFRC